MPALLKKLPKQVAGAHYLCHWAWLCWCRIKGTSSPSPTLKRRLWKSPTIPITSARGHRQLEHGKVQCAMSRCQHISWAGASTYPGQVQDTCKVLRCDSDRSWGSTSDNSNSPILMDKYPKAAAAHEVAMGQSSYTEAQDPVLGLVRCQVWPPLGEVPMVHQFLPQKCSLLTEILSLSFPQASFCRRNDLVPGNVIDLMPWQRKAKVCCFD